MHGQDEEAQDEDLLKNSSTTSSSGPASGCSMTWSIRSLVWCGMATSGATRAAPGTLPRHQLHGFTGHEAQFVQRTSPSVPKA